jgi:hypothetical protein
MKSRIEDSPLVMTLARDGPTLDPEQPLLEEELFEEIAPSRRERVAAGIRLVRRVFLPHRRRWRRVVAVDPPGALARIPSPAWTFLARALRRWLVPLFITSVLALEVWVVWMLLSGI